MINNQFLFNYDENNNYEIFQQEEIEPVEDKCIIEEKPSIEENTNTTVVLDKDIDDTETLDGFLNDTTKLLKNKGIDIKLEALPEETPEKKVFSFFDDL